VGVGTNNRIRVIWLTYQEFFYVVLETALNSLEQFTGSQYIA